MSNETFRIRRTFFVQGAFFTTAFFILALGHASFLLFIRPPQWGFKTAGSVVGVSLMGVAVYGGMALLGCYLLLSYRLTSLLINGTTVAIRTVFQNRRFNISELQQLTWKPFTDKLVFLVHERKASLELQSFSDEDQLKIIRLLRSLIPDDKQQNWAQYCQRIAIPLRRRMELDPARPLEPGEVLITRGRYDRVFAVIFPMAILGAVAFWWRIGSLFLFSFSAFLLLGWIFLRYQIPRVGYRSIRGTISISTFNLLGIGIIGLLSLVLFLFTKIDREHLVIAISSLLFLLSMVGLFRQDKRQKRWEHLEPESAPECWERGETA